MATERWIAALLTTATLVTSSVVGMTREDAAEPVENDPPAYLRVDSEEGRSVALEVAAHRYRPGDGVGPEITLVGVVHIGDQQYYRDVQRLLEAHELVLFESVMPAGTGGAGGETPEERVASTRAAMEFLARGVSTFREARGAWPEDLASVRAFLTGVDPRLSSFFDNATLDAWSRPIDYTCCAVTTVESSSSPLEEARPVLTSLGADQRPGGRGADADLHVIPGDETLMIGLEQDNIQSQLADALNLAFQLEAIDYGRPSWRCSDMAIDQLKRELDRRGADFTILEETLAGTSFSARIARILLQAIQLFDRFTDGAVSDTVKVVLIEMLADESLIELSMQQFDPALTEVLIDVRNQVVIDDLGELIDARPPDARSVAVFYGAGHMQDLAERLREQLGYVHEDGQWYPAIAVDLTESAVSQREVLQMRLMIRRMMRQMSRMQHESE